MSTKRHKSRRPKAHHHKRIPNRIKEEVLQLRAMGHTRNEVAVKTLLGYSSIEYIEAQAKNDPEMMRKARAGALIALAGRVNEKALLALEKVTEDSLTHDRVEVRDKEGKLVAVNHSGPNGAQIATAVGILVDKSEKLQDRADQLLAGTEGALTPEKIGELLDSVKGRISRLSLHTDMGGVQQKLELITKNYDPGDDEAEEIDADYEILDDD